MKRLRAAVLKGDMILDAIAGVVLAFMIVLTLCDVILRNLGHPITGSMEIIQYGGSIVFGFSVPYATWIGAQVIVDLVTQKLGLKNRKRIAAVTTTVGTIMFLFIVTGWRIGYTAGPLPLIKAMNKIQGQLTSNPTHISQIATLAALTGPQDCVGQMRKAFDERRQEMVKLLRAIPGVTCREPKGAFYAFPNVETHVGKKSPEGSILDDDVQLCDWLVEVGKVAVVPAPA